MSLVKSQFAFNPNPPRLKKNDLAEITAPYYESLPENKREEITIIDNFMVEVGLGSGLESIKSIIQDAIKSIPSVGKTFPEFLLVNSDPIFFIGNGLYSWDSEGSNPVKLKTSVIKKFDTITVSASKHSQGDETALTKPVIASLESNETAFEIQPAATVKFEESLIPPKKILR